MLRAVTVADLAEEFNVSRVRVRQIVAEFEQSKQTSIGCIVGTSLAFTESEANRLRNYRSKMRSWTKSEKAPSQA